MRTATLTFRNTSGETITAKVTTPSSFLSRKPVWTGDQNFLNRVPSKLRDLISISELVAAANGFARENKASLKVTYTGHYDLMDELVVKQEP